MKSSKTLAKIINDRWPRRWWAVLGLQSVVPFNSSSSHMALVVITSYWRKNGVIQECFHRESPQNAAHWEFSAFWRFTITKKIARTSDLKNVAASLLEIYHARRPGFSACFFGDITKMCVEEFHRIVILNSGILRKIGGPYGLSTWFLYGIAKFAKYPRNA